MTPAHVAGFPVEETLLMLAPVAGAAVLASRAYAGQLLRRLRARRAAENAPNAPARPQIPAPTDIWGQSP